MHIFIWAILHAQQNGFYGTRVSNVNCKGNIYCNQRGQPSHAAVEGEGRIALHHESNQEQLDESTEGLRRSGRRCWFIIYEQD